MKKINILTLISFLFVFCLPVCGQKAEDISPDAVMQAVVHNDISALAELVKQNVSVDEQDANGTTPLIYAAKNGSLLMTDILVRLGADPTLKDNEGLSAIAWAARGEEDIKTLDISVNKSRILKSSLTKPFARKAYQRILFDSDNGTVAVLNCDDLLEVQDLVFCQAKVGDNITWELYNSNGEYLVLAQDVERVSHKGRDYFILQKWGEYSIILPSGIPLKDHLKQVKHKIDKKKDKTGILVFNIINANGQKETFSPNAKI